MYYYKVGNPTITSNISTFTTAPTPNDNMTFIILADLGVEGGMSTINLLNSLTQSVDFALVVGDISYADNDFLAFGQWNTFMNALAPFNREKPFMVCVGNHEAECHSPACQVSAFKRNHLGNYSAFNSRFRMPSRESKGVKNMWYGFDAGSIHFTSISSESDYPGAPTNVLNLFGASNGDFGNQLRWLEAELAAADANRKNVPWLIVTIHRPIYDITNVDAQNRPTKQHKKLQAAFEELFLKYNVDLVFSGHIHSYQRHFPISRNMVVKNGVSADLRTYLNVKAPIYIVSGAAGNNEYHEQGPFRNTPWLAHEDHSNFGIHSVRATRESLEWYFIGSESKTVLDAFVMIKDRHLV
jgi:predicted MPP superfamily phosphohydrolase